MNVRKALSKQTHPKLCPHCGGVVELTQANRFYHRAPAKCMIYRCVKCTASVSCKPGTNIAIGFLADETTRAARKSLHTKMTQYLEAKKINKEDFYDWMQRELELPFSRRGIGWLNKYECLKMIAAIQQAQNVRYEEVGLRGIAKLREMLSAASIDRGFVAN